MENDPAKKNPGEKEPSACDLQQAGRQSHAAELHRHKPQARCN